VGLADGPYSLAIDTVVAYVVLGFWPCSTTLAAVNFVINVTELNAFILLDPAVILISRGFVFYQQQNFYASFFRRIPFS